MASRIKKGEASLWIPTGVLFLSYFFLCAFLVSPYIGWYDSGEMVGATACLGISHPSGQAVYHLLGKVFLLFPWGTPAFRLGLLSSFCGALALSLFWVLSLKLAAHWGVWKDRGDRARHPPSPFGLRRTSASPLRTTDYFSLPLKGSLLFLSLLWALSLPWWRSSVLTEVYALHLAFGMAVLWSLSLDRPFKWPLVFFLLGVSTVFRPTQMFALPLAAVLFLIERKGRWKGVPKQALLCFWGFLLGRSTLLYLPLRSALEPPIAYADLTHPWALVKHILGLGFSKFLGTATLETLLKTLGGMAQRAWTDLTPVGAFLLLAGAVLLLRRARQAPSFLWIALAWGAMEALLVLAVPYPVFEPHMMLLAWGFAGFIAVLPLAWIHGSFTGDRVRVLGGVLALGILLQLSGAGGLMKARSARDAEDYARNVLGVMGPSALYIPAEENEYFPVVGLQQSLGFRRDVKAVMPGTKLEVFAPWVREALAVGRPVYLTREWEGLPEGWRYKRKGPILEVTREAVWEPVPGGAGGRPIASWGGVRIQQAFFDPMEAEQGQRVGFVLDWSRSHPGPQDEAGWVSILFTDAEGNFLVRDGVIWLHDIHRPFGGGLPFPAMKQGQTYREREEIWIPSDYPPGVYWVMAALQKTPARAQDERKTPSSFYEDRRQGIGKFAGRVEGADILHFTALAGTPEKETFWPVEGSTLRPRGDFFVPLAKLTIRPRSR